VEEGYVSQAGIMPKNITSSLGNIALIVKIDAETEFFEFVLINIGGRDGFVPKVPSRHYFRCRRGV